MRAMVGLCALVLVLTGCGRAEEPSARETGATASLSHPSDAASRRTDPAQFSCPVDGLAALGESSPIPDIDRLTDIVEGVEQTTWHGFVVERVEATHLGVVALVSGDLDAARRSLGGVGVAHVRRWDPSVAVVGVDAAGQVQQVLQWLTEDALREVRAGTRGIEGYQSLALWTGAGAVVLQWKAPVPAAVRALGGVRPDGVMVIVKPARFSARDVRAASARVGHAIRAGRVDAEWSTTGGCADGSGLVVGITPDSLGDRRPALQAQLGRIAGMPVHVVPEEAPVARTG